MDFSAIDGVVMDMDGVVWRGDQVLPGAGALLDFLRWRELPYMAATNNSARSPADYVVKLAGMGLTGWTEDQILTSGRVTMSYLRDHYPPETPVFVVGGDGLKAMIARAGYELADNARVVVAGIDFDLTYSRVRRAALLIRAGADFIGTNEDATFPMPDGLVPGAGSIIALLKTATDRYPVVMGKPHRPMFDAALKALGTSPERTLMIGDRLDTDILGAQQAGLPAALVLTGVTSRRELDASPIRPDAVYDDLNALLAAWDEVVQS
jgi:4-nitrophenyl phosphatase